MTPYQIEIVKASFANVVPIAKVAADLFYKRLFEIAPEVKPLFKTDISEQGQKLMAALSLIVSGLDNMETILPLAKKMAIRHVAYGVKPDHYRAVGDALIWTLQEGLGRNFTPVVRDAWIMAYRTLSSVMIEKAYGPVDPS